MFTIVYRCFSTSKKMPLGQNFYVPIGLFFTMLMGTIPMMGHVLARISNKPTTRPPRLSCPRAVEGHQPAIDPHLSREKGWCFSVQVTMRISHIYIYVYIYIYLYIILNYSI